MNKPSDFDTAKATGQYSALEAGGYVCTIVGLDETVSASGNEMIRVALDIAEGGEKGRFMEQFKKNTNPEPKWPNNAVMYILTKDYKDQNKTNGNFKQFINCVVESNNGFQVEWGDNFAKGFKGKSVGIVFGREEYITNDGELKWSTKAKYVNTVEEIKTGKFSVPKDKELSEAEKAKKLGGAPTNGFGPVEEEEIPF